ncbi:hypothetical protein B0H15DRAFT_865764 [Mycena belliarum]|uniref:SET domain-containing protein n=1 Tax=Mycena belliarum TaxID=1033014 RepID=A0AAD6TPY8_9AGAR|nr:hypothetical protein B0H15DRAFT_865764 [Mycena belliae]
MTDVVAALISWCSERGYWIDPRIELALGPYGVAVLSKDTTIPADTILVRIPRESVLSVKSSPISALIPPHRYGRGAQLALALALSVELVNSATSPWSAYLESLPRKIPGIPLFWASGAHTKNGHAREWLHRTEAGKMLFGAGDCNSALFDEIGEYFNSVAHPVYLKLFEPATIPSLTDFYLAYALVTSRSFLVDCYHGLSMVPIADAFNHAQDNHVHLESDFDVCPECGSLQRCVHDDTADSDMRISIPDAADNFYEMVSNLSIPPRTEVFNTYGETLSNAELLVQYGFILEGNENDRITWTFRDLAQFSEQHLPQPWDWRAVGGLDAFQDLITSLIALPWAAVAESGLVYLDRTHAFCLNGDAAISHGLWLYCALLLCLRKREYSGPYSRDSVATVLDQMLQSQLTLELDAPPSPGDALNMSPYGGVFELAEVLAALCRARMGGAPASKDLGDILDRLPNDEDVTPTRMAISLALTERSLLDSCTAAWEGLAEGQV